MTDTCVCSFDPKNIVSSVQGKDVFKDECVLCFTDTRSENGIFLDLTDLQGFCVKCVELHFEKNKHPIYLNIKATPKPKRTEDGEKITKLAIGVEGGAQSLQIEYDTAYKMVCKACPGKIDQDNFQGQIKSIEMAGSVNSNKEVDTWEEEFRPCECVLTLQQCPPMKIKSNLQAKCADCDVSCNLWLNLVDGHLGCGRKQYDGSGGNGHGLAHYEKTSHCISVKTGTISADGKASVHCYKCGDDIVDPYLHAHLANFGIIMNEMQKTEKTMTEINLEMNLNFTLSTSFEKGVRMEPIFGPDLTGMFNIGNSCYINVIVQSMFAIPEFRRRYYEFGQNHIKASKKRPADCYMTQLCKLAHGLCSGDFSIKLEDDVFGQDGNPTGEKVHFQEGIKPYRFKQLVAKNHNEFTSNRQQDATEYLIHFWQTLQKAEEEYQLSETENLFKFKMQTKNICMGCKSYTLNESNSKILDLPLPQPSNFDGYESKAIEELEYKVNLSDCVKLFQNEGTYTKNCTKCNEDCLFAKVNYIEEFPKYLVLHIKNIAVIGWVPRKLHSQLQFDPENIDLSELILHENQGETLCKKFLNNIFRAK